MRTKPTRQQLDKAAGRRPKAKRNLTAALMQHIAESDRTLLQRSLASDHGRMGNLVERMPATILARPLARSRPAPSLPGSSSSSSTQPPYLVQGGRYRAGMRLNATRDAGFTGPGTQIEQGQKQFFGSKK